jgi:hypothetical protein
MPSLRQQVADKKAQEPALRRNPEIDARLDRYLVENPGLVEYYQGLSKDDLIRKLAFGQMRRSEVSERRNTAVRAWVEDHPEVKERIEERIANVPAENRERAFINAANSEAARQAVRGNGIRPS